MKPGDMQRRGIQKPECHDRSFLVSWLPALACLGGLGRSQLVIRAKALDLSVTMITERCSQMPALIEAPHRAALLRPNASSRRYCARSAGAAAPVINAPARNPD